MTRATLELMSTSVATTYRFRGKDERGDLDLGWACCTVNDTTGELAITSDWGNNAHRWDVRNLGNDGRTTLTQFIAGGSVDYIADKLTRQIVEPALAALTAQARAVMDDLAKKELG